MGDEHCRLIVMLGAFGHALGTPTRSSRLQEPPGVFSRNVVDHRGPRVEHMR
jgi:hypothetical protein